MSDASFLGYPIGEVEVTIELEGLGQVEIGGQINTLANMTNPAGGRTLVVVLDEDEMVRAVAGRQLHGL